MVYNRYSDDQERAVRKYDDYYGYNDYYGYRPSSIDLKECLGPVIKKLERYDALRTMLETRGGSIRHLDEISEILTTEIEVDDPFRRRKVILSDQRSLQDFLQRVDHFDLSLGVRQLDTRMPVYYICRISSQYWSNYSLIVEDIYLSPGYPVIDTRFVKLMRAGHEIYYLRLSPFRFQLESLFNDAEISTRREKVDQVLRDVGKLILQAAWHEDQRLGIEVAERLDLLCFKNAIELLYLCLSAELCELRSAVNKTMLNFFELAYPQPAILKFLNCLTNLDGRTLTDLPQKALKLYTKLSKAFNRFLNQEVTWGYHKGRIPIYKLVLGNLSRLHMVEGEFSAEKSIKSAYTGLEKTAQAIIDDLLDLPTGDSICKQWH